MGICHFNHDWRCRTLFGIRHSLPQALFLIWLPSSPCFQEQFELIQGKIAKEQRRRRQDESTCDTSVVKRVQLIKLLTKLEEKRKAREGKEGYNLSVDISENHTAVETWASLRKTFFKAAMAGQHCAYCGKTYKTSIKASPLGTGVDVSWPWGSEKPFSKATWRSMTDGALKGKIESLYVSLGKSQYHELRNG